MLPALHPSIGPRPSNHPNAAAHSMSTKAFGPAPSRQRGRGGPSAGHGHEGAATTAHLGTRVNSRRSTVPIRMKKGPSHRGSLRFHLGVREPSQKCKTATAVGGQDLIATLPGLLHLKEHVKKTVCLGGKNVCMSATIYNIYFGRTVHVATSYILYIYLPTYKHFSLQDKVLF